jgi:hypothetical protein
MPMHPTYGEVGREKMSNQKADRGFFLVPLECPSADSIVIHLIFDVATFWECATCEKFGAFVFPLFRHFFDKR